MLSESELNDLRETLLPYSNTLAQTVSSVIDQDISNYPVFILHKNDEEIGIGLSVIAGDNNSKGWFVNISTLEELAAKQVIAMEKVTYFTDIYKKNKGTFCCFVWINGNAQVIFIPMSK